ncbi:hypothetical protein HaLaN_26423, partial [Haematococcus lacustris]
MFELSQALASLPALLHLALPDALEGLVLPANTLAQLQSLSMPCFMLPQPLESAELPGLTRLEAASPACFLNNRGSPLQALPCVHYPALRSCTLGVIEVQHLSWLAACTQLTQLHVQVLGGRDLGAWSLAIAEAEGSEAHRSQWQQ